jgi:hypothetical protein
MGIKIYHQVGHNDIWNINSFSEDHSGDGLILSPVHQSLPHVVELEGNLRRRSLFDPQFYLPNSPKAKLSSYPFFPDQIANGFSTLNFLLIAGDSAKQCVEFQIEQEFEGIVIPARFVDQMASKYFENQEELTVRPFLGALAAAGVAKPVYLTVPITSAMLQDEGFQLQLLNWLTGFPEISGVYILVADDRKTKQIRSEKFLFAYLKFAHELAGTGLGVVLGHLNTENILFSIIEGITLTFGSFENTRMFSLDKFVDSEEERRGPKARIYLPKLLNWVRYEQAMQIRNENAALWEKVYTPTDYADRVIAAGIEPTFNQSPLYMHHFECVSEQIKQLGRVSVSQRFQTIRAQIKSAIDLHAEIAEGFFDLDTHGNGEHLQPWLDAINRFYRNYLKD